MSVRLKDFDYKRPYFYMDKVKRAEEVPDLARETGDAASHYVEPDANTSLCVGNLLKEGL